MFVQRWIHFYELWPLHWPLHLHEGQRGNFTKVKEELEKRYFLYVCMQYAIQNSEYPGTGTVGYCTANLNPDFHILDFRKCDVLLKRSSIIIWHLPSVYSGPVKY